MIYKDKSKMTGMYQNSLPIGTHIKIFPDQTMDEIKFTD